jgi:hypothetical protein
MGLPSLERNTSHLSPYETRQRLKPALFAFIDLFGLHLRGMVRHAFGRDVDEFLVAIPIFVFGIEMEA